jgi:LPXTG-motif cell wall-anchored protein
MRYLPLLLVPLLVVMMVFPGTLMAYGPTVDLLTTSNFAVLASSTITNVPTTNISGDAGVNIGINTAGSIDGGIVLNGVGTTHVNDAVAIQAQTDLVTVYNDAAGRTNTAIVPVELGGTTLTSGVYSSGGVLQITGTLTLDAQGDPNAVFIFKSTATLETAVGSSVNLINGARYCRVFWVVPSSATLGANSTFVGHIFAMTSITANSGATIQGQLLARTGAVTLSANNILNGVCPTYSGGILTIYKVDSAGNPIVATTPALSAAFNIYTNSADVGVNPPFQAGSTIQDTNFFNVSLPNGTYYVAEKTAPEGYSIDTNVQGVTITGADKTLTFTNGSSGGSVSSGAANTTVGTSTTTTPTTVTSTVTGGQLPKTSTSWYNILFAGIVITLIGGAASLWIIQRKRVNA